MRLATNEPTLLQSAQSPGLVAGDAPSLMTPARRAALDALEREFHDLLVRDVLKTVAR